MKNITALLQNGNLTPKERYLLLIQNDVIKQKTGKEHLTEADKEALNNWRAKTNEEAREWNKYNDGWRLNGRAMLESEFVYLETRGEHLRKFFLNLNLNFYPLFREQRRLLNRLEKIKVVDVKEALEISNKQREQKIKNGFNFDYAVYELAFESLNEEDKKKFTELYEDVEFDHQYLDQEEIIADLFDGKDKLTEKAKENLAELVAGHAYNAYAGKYQLYHYFACIPLAEVARQFLINKGIKIKGKLLAKNQEADDEDSHTHDEVQEAVEKYAQENKITIETILKESCLKWLSEDLFEQYRPLIISNEKELFERWKKTKVEAKTTLQKFIDKGELKIRKLSKTEMERDTFVNELNRQKLEKSVLGKQCNSDILITGDSLYTFASEYKFIKDFKKQVDEYDPNLGMVYADDDIEHKGDNLDREFLIGSRNNKGELNIFSVFGLTLARLKAIFEVTQYIEETEQDGEFVLDFDHDNLKKIFREAKESLIDGYAKLLAFRDFFKRQENIYETDLCFTINIRIDTISDCIDQHNDALKKATKDKFMSDDSDKELDKWLAKNKQVSRMKEDYSIDKDKIAPDAGIIKEYDEKLREIFRNEF